MRMLPMVSDSGAKLFSVSSLYFSSRVRGFFNPRTTSIMCSAATFGTKCNDNEKKKAVKKLKKTKAKKKKKKDEAESKAVVVKEKKRTRSDREFEMDAVQRFGDTTTHVPVMLGEVVDVFSATNWRPLRSFVDCTLGAAGHSSAVSSFLHSPTLL